MDFLELARARFSVRKFSDRPVEQEKLDRIIEAGRVAPTAKNFQPHRVFIMKSAEAMAKMNALSPCIYGAPMALLFCYDEEEAWHNPQTAGYDSGEMDATIVATHMMLAAWEQGIGSCWVGVFDHDAAAKAFDLPANIKPVSMMPLGYAAEDCVPAPRHTEYRPVEENFIEL